VKRGREEGVSFAVRGNLVLLAPPLVVREDDLLGALALLERLLASLEWS
jgi:taurine--2-oxoglutarate transaminase